MERKQFRFLIVLFSVLVTNMCAAIALEWKAGLFIVSVVCHETTFELTFAVGCVKCFVCLDEDVTRLEGH